MSLGHKFRDIPLIAEWNYLEVDTSGECSVRLQVKRSVMDNKFYLAFDGNMEFFLRKPNASPNTDGVPNLMQSSAVDNNMRKPLKGEKLRNLAEMYKFYIDPNRWTSQLVSVMADEDADIMDNDSKSGDPLNAEFEEKSLRIGALLDSEEEHARVHSFLRRVHGAEKLSDADLLAKMQETHQTQVFGKCREQRDEDPRINSCETVITYINLANR